MPAGGGGRGRVGEAGGRGRASPKHHTGGEQKAAVGVLAGWALSCDVNTFLLPPALTHEQQVHVVRQQRLLVGHGQQHKHKLPNLAEVEPHSQRRGGGVVEGTNNGGDLEGGGGGQRCKRWVWRGDGCAAWTADMTWRSACRYPQQPATHAPAHHSWSATPSAAHQDCFGQDDHRRPRRQQRQMVHQEGGAQHQAG